MKRDKKGKQRVTNITQKTEDLAKRAKLNIDDVFMCYRKIGNSYSFKTTISQEVIFFYIICNIQSDKNKLHRFIIS